jgi:hypothetical protein
MTSLRTAELYDSFFHSDTLVKEITEILEKYLITSPSDQKLLILSVFFIVSKFKLKSKLYHFVVLDESR